MTTRNLTRLAAAALFATLAVGLFAACSTTPGEPRAESQNSTAVGVSGRADTGSSEAAVEDFAAAVAEHHAGWDDQVATTDSDCVDPNLVFACSAGYTTLGYQAATIHLSLSALHKPNAPGFVGEPPEKIRDLVADTENAAEAVSVAAEDLTAAGCDDPLALECASLLFTLDSAISDLSGKLDAWEVYS